MQTGRGGIEADVTSDLFLGERLAHALGLVMDKTAPLQFGEQVHQPLLYNPVCSSPGVRRSRASSQRRSAPSREQVRTASPTNATTSERRTRRLPCRVCPTRSTVFASDSSPTSITARWFRPKTFARLSIWLPPPGRT